LPAAGGGGDGGGAALGAEIGGIAVTVGFPVLLLPAVSSDWHIATLNAMTAMTATIPT
jgi:hypothetical protein